jgi:hypothetical protein
MKKIVSILCIVLSASDVCAHSSARVSYSTQTESDMLQVGALELYCAQNMQYEARASACDAHKATLHFQLPGVVIQPPDLATLNGIQGAGYQIALQAKNKQYELVITYDPTLVLVTYAPTVSIDMQHGLVIRFFDQMILQKMRSHDKPVLCVACL